MKIVNFAKFPSFFSILYKIPFVRECFMYRNLQSSRYHYCKLFIRNFSFSVDITETRWVHKHDQETEKTSAY